MWERSENYSYCAPLMLLLLLLLFVYTYSTYYIEYACIFSYSSLLFFFYYLLLFSCHRYRADELLCMSGEVLYAAYMSLLYVHADFVFSFSLSSGLFFFHYYYCYYCDSCLIRFERSHCCCTKSEWVSLFDVYESTVYTLYYTVSHIYLCIVLYRWLYSVLNNITWGTTLCILFWRCI